MSYKLLEISAFYTKYLEYFYQKNPNLENLDYNNHLKFLLSDCFAECDFIHPELHKLGVESKIVIYNDERIQRKWKEDYKNNTLFEIVCEQIKEYQPDVIFFSDMTILNEEQYNHIRNMLDNKCKFVGWHFTIVNDSNKNIFKCFDQIYTGNKYILTLIKPYCKDVRLLYHGFETSIFNKVNPKTRTNKIVFPGSIFMGEEIHNNRIDMFGKLYSKNIPCEFYGNIYGSFLPHTPKQLVKWILQKNKPSKDRITTEKLLRKNIKQSVFGLDYYRVLANYSICVNQHAAIACTGSGNMRMFEATGMGACLLTDYREENVDLFVPDEEIVVYKNYDELIEKAEYLINNPAAASDIAKRGQQRTLNTHSYKQKAEKMNEYILELFRK